MSPVAPPPPGAPDGARRRVLAVGLTGGIACGKTTVAGHFAAWGAHVIDADAVARRLVEPGAAGYGPVVREFGDAILLPGGALDRAALGRIVFADPARRARLEAILHPLIVAEERAAIGRLEAAGRPRVAVVNAALLFEAGTFRDYDRLVVVTCDESIQVDRIVARDGLTPEAALARIRAQRPAAEKVRHAHYVIDTGAGFEATEARAREVWARLEADLRTVARRM